MSKKHLNELHWKDEYNGMMLKRNVETGQTYLLPWNYDVKLNLETGEYVSPKDKEAWAACAWSTINELNDKLESYSPTMIGEIRNRIWPEILQQTARRKWGVDIPLEYYERAMAGWLNNRSAGKQYIHVGEEYVLFAPAACINMPRLEIHKYFPNCEWMQVEGEV